MFAGLRALTQAWRILPTNGWALPRAWVGGWLPPPPPLSASRGMIVKEWVGHLPSPREGKSLISAPDKGQGLEGWGIQFSCSLPLLVGTGVPGLL